MGLITWWTLGLLSDEEFIILSVILFYIIIVPLSIFYLFFGDVIEYRICSFGVVAMSVIYGLYWIHTKSEKEN